MPNLPGVREKTSDEKKKKFLRRIAYKGGKGKHLSKEDRYEGYVVVEAHAL